MRILFAITLFFLCGCTTMDTHKTISPSESIYYKANDFYENKDFDAAIELYKEYLEKRPRSDLSVAAKLNLGMSHYYSGDYKDAYMALKGLDPKDDNIKIYINDVLKVCETKAGDEIKAEELAGQAQAATQQAGAGEIEIEVLDAYLDNFGSVVLKGKTNTTSTVIVGNKEVTTDKNNTFTASVRWNKGSPIVLSASHKNGSSGELMFYPDGESPKKPEGLREINTSANSAEIEWDKSYENDIKGYRLFYTLPSGSTREVPEWIKETKHEVVGLQSYVEGSNKTFKFYIRAIDKMNNESENSDILAVTLP